MVVQVYLAARVLVGAQALEVYSCGQDYHVAWFDLRSPLLLTVISRRSCQWRLAVNLASLQRSYALSDPPFHYEWTFKSSAVALP